MDDEHARVGGHFVHDVGEEERALLRRRPRAERLADGHNVVVDGLGHAHHRQVVLVGLEELGELRGREVRVVAAHGVQDGHAVLHELVRRHLLRVILP